MSKQIRSKEELTLLAFFMDSFPEMSSKYCNANKEERAKMREANKKILNKLTGNRK